MIKLIKPAVIIFIGAIVLAGCTQLSAEQSFLEVSDNVLERTGRKILWNNSRQKEPRLTQSCLRLASISH